MFYLHVSHLEACVTAFFIYLTQLHVTRLEAPTHTHTHTHNMCLVYKGTHVHTLKHY